MVEHNETISRLLPTNCLSVFDHFVRLALQGLTATKILMSWVFRQLLGTALIFFSLSPVGLKNVRRTISYLRI